jgi:hypothetical protein
MTVSRSMGVWAYGRSSVWYPELGCSGMRTGAFSVSILVSGRTLGVRGKAFSLSILDDTDLFRASGLLGLDTAENVLPEKGLLLSNHEK